ncbi:MAG: hypothetical protein C4545_08810 [Anaerolineaceae bacterium]|nr:MAG: hypothetical protein C4545_08810 [Anaerolineaceae bacterium]
MYFLSALQVIKFPPVSLSAWLYLVIFVTTQVLGAFLGGLGKNTKWQNETERSRALFSYLASSKAITIICILGLVGVIFSLYDSIILTGFDPFQPNISRDVLNIIYSHKSTWINRIATLTQPFAWLSIILVALYSDYLKPKIKLLCFFIIIGLISLGVASAGRTIMVRIFLILFLVILARKSLGFKSWPWKWNFITRSMFVILITGFIYYFFYVWIWRAGGSESLIVNLKNYSIYAEESQGLNTFLNKFVPNNFKGSFSLLTFYIFTFADNFALFFDKVYIQPFWGLWHFFSFASAFSKFGFTNLTSDGIYLSVFSSYRSVGLWSAQWRTMAQEYILDFGRVGALVASFGSGLVIGWVYKALRKGSYQWLGLYIVLASWAIYGAYTSAFTPGQFLIFLYSLIYGWAARKKYIKVITI